MRELEPADLLCDRAGERSPLMSKQFALEQSARDGFRHIFAVTVGIPYRQAVPYSDILLVLGGHMATSVWKGFLTFGLISIPIRLSTAARSERISFNQLHSVCHTRIKMPTFCPTCDRMVDRSEIEKGYEYEKGQYLLFTPQELEEIEPDSARSMEILEFVKLAEIDPLYFDSSYYVAPDEGGAKPYNLLLDAMNTSGYAGIAKLTMHGRENIVIIRPRKNGLTLHTMFYSNEIRSADEFGGGDRSDVKDAERKLATQLIQTLAAKFEPEKYRDAYQEELEKLIEAKAHGQKLAVVPHKVLAPAVDLMAALKKSIEQKPASGKTLLKSVPEPSRKRKAG